MSVAMAAGPTPHSVSPTGRLRQETLGHCDRSFAIWTHLSPLLGFLLIGPLAIFAPIVLWVARKDGSPFVDDHGREVVNFCISFMMLHVVLGLTIIGAVAYPALWVVGLISIIRGAAAAGRNEYFRYPITIRLV